MSNSSFTDAVFITGASRGIGLGYVSYYLDSGFNVIATARNVSEALILQGLQISFSDKLLLLELDVTNEASIKNFCNHLESTGASITIAINNAGLAKEEAFGNWTSATFQLHFKANVIGPALISQAILPFMKKGGKLIQISSGMGSVGWNISPENALDAYAASKCALHSITVRLAKKLKNNKIIVVALNPGWVQTEMGGAAATSNVAEAVDQITKTINNIKQKDSGKFISETGDIIPW